MSQEVLHVSDAQGRTLRTRLLSRARQLADEIDSGLHAERLGQEPFDPGSDEEAAVGIAAIQRDTGELREIEDALARMQNGAYGLCIDCGAALPFVRLDALPHASRCLQCESERERSKARPASLCAGARAGRTHVRVGEPITVI
jgi:DnaK suppressor protein